MSGNKIIPIIAGILCVIVIGSVFGVSALNKKSGKNNIEQPSVSQTDSASQTVTAGNAQTESFTSTDNADDTKSEADTSSEKAQTSVTTVSSAPSSSEASSSSKNTASTTKTTKTTKKSEYMYAYAGFNPVTTDMSVPIERLLLNRKYKLPDGYVPPLATAAPNSSRPDIKLHKQVAPHYQEMYNAAKKDGITLTPVSGYRSYQRQKNNFDNQIKTYMNQGMNKVTATQKAAEIRLLPGTSEHNAGIAMDICSLSTKFDQTKEFRWLQAHAHEYGFIMRYPKDKTNVTKITYEPWHYRYVGKDIASQLKSSGQVLEEYLGKDA